MTDDATPPDAAPADEARDPYLRAALRHAPDAAEGPPEAVSARILAEARGSVASAAAARRNARPQPRIASRLRELWIATARPSVAGAFATVVVATLVGVLWWERPLEEAMVRPPPAAPSPATAPENADTATPSSRVDATTSAAAAPAPGASTHDARVPEAFPAPREPAPRAAAQASARKTRPAPQPAPRSRDDAGAKADESADADVPKELGRPETAVEARREGDADRAAATSNEPGLAPRAAAPPPARADALAGRLQARREASTASSLSGLRARVQSAPERWTWARDGGLERRPAASLAAWLAQAEEAARGPVHAAAPGAPDTTRHPDAVAARLEVELFDAGRREAILRLTPAGLELVDAAGRTQQIALDPAARAALASSLPR